MATTSNPYTQQLRQLSAMSNLPSVNMEEFDEYLQQRKRMLKQREQDHEIWKTNFEKNKERVMHRVSELTRRSRQRVQQLEKVLEEAYSRFVHNRNTTDHEKTVERAILSRQASRVSRRAGAIQDGPIPEDQEVLHRQEGDLQQQEVSHRPEVVLEQYPLRQDAVLERTRTISTPRASSRSKPSTANSRPVTRSRSGTMMPPVIRSTRTSRERHLSSRELPRL